MENKKIARYAAWSAAFLFTAVLLWLTFRFVLPAALPLLFALLISSAVRPLARIIGKKSKTSARVSGAVIIAVAVFALIYAAVCLGGKLFHEMTEFLTSAVADLEGDDNIVKRIVDFFESLPERLPFLSSLQLNTTSELYDEIYSFVLSSAKEAAAKLSTGATSFAAGFIKGLPNFVFAVVVSVIALFYLTVDFDGVRSGIKKLLPENIHGSIGHICHGFAGAVSGYIRAYLVLMLLTFGELLLGFVIMGIKYAFFLAFLISLIDILPVFGVGCVLLPWSTVLFIKGETTRAVGMLILFGIMYIVRQFAEPRLIGRFMGIHPLLTLSAAYMGFRFFGIVGMISAPASLYIIKLTVNEKSSM